MTNVELEAGEKVLGSWSVYTGAQGMNTAKVTGKLNVTEGNLYFSGGIVLAENAGTAISNREQAFEGLNGQVKIPLADIAALRISKTFFILKSLEITLRSGEKLAFHFGAMSPKAACAAICSRTGLIPD